MSRFRRAIVTLNAQVTSLTNTVLALPITSLSSETALAPVIPFSILNCSHALSNMPNCTANTCACEILIIFLTAAAVGGGAGPQAAPLPPSATVMVEAAFFSAASFMALFLPLPLPSSPQSSFPPSSLLPMLQGDNW